MSKPEDAKFSGINSEFYGQKVYDNVLELGRVPAANNATFAQIALNYPLCKPGVSSVIMDIRTPEWIADNLRTSDWQMPLEEMNQLDKVSKLALAYPYNPLEHVQHD